VEKISWQGPGDLMPEIWRPVPRFEDYEVSSKARVRSLARLIHMRNGRTRRHAGQILTPI
jgi:hypothetical protein